MSFEEYLIGKKIDPKKFKEAETERYKEFAEIFVLMHPNSFTVQKLNLINFIRRKYPLNPELIKDEPTAQAPPETPKATRPLFVKK